MGSPLPCESLNYPVRVCVLELPKILGLSMKKILLIITLTISLFSKDINDFIDLKKCDQIIDKQVYKICYSYKHKGALAVWYELDGNLVNKTNVKKRPRFYNEKNIPMKYRTKYKDYTHSGFDRGHLANDASFDYDEKIVRKTYTMANIVPQYPNLNRRTWIKAERYERSIAVKLGKVKIINLVDYSNSPGTIGNGVSIPSSFQKILINDDNKFLKCFEYQNIKDIDSKQYKLKHFECNKKY